MKFLKTASIPVRIAIIAVTMALLLGAYAKQQAPAIMTSAAKNFLNSLEPWQKTAVSFKMDDEERANWFYTRTPGTSSGGPGCWRTGPSNAGGLPHGRQLDGRSRADDP